MPQTSPDTPHMSTLVDGGVVEPLHLDALGGGEDSTGHVVGVDGWVDAAAFLLASDVVGNAGKDSLVAFDVRRCRVRGGVGGLDGEIQACEVFLMYWASSVLIS